MDFAVSTSLERALKFIGIAQNRIPTLVQTFDVFGHTTSLFLRGIPEPVQ